MRIYCIERSLGAREYDWGIRLLLHRKAIPMNTSRAFFEAATRVRYKNYTLLCWVSIVSAAPPWTHIIRNRETYLAQNTERREHHNVPPPHAQGERGEEGEREKTNRTERRSLISLSAIFWCFIIKRKLLFYQLVLWRTWGVLNPPPLVLLYFTRRWCQRKSMAFSVEAWLHTESQHVKSSFVSWGRQVLRAIDFDDPI